MPPPWRMDCDAKILMRVAPASFSLRIQTRVAQDVAASVQQHTRADDDPPLFCLDCCGILLRGRAHDEDSEEEESDPNGSDRRQPLRKHSVADFSSRRSGASRAAIIHGGSG